MSKKESQDVIRFLNNYDYEDIAIALMAIENNNESLPLSDENYTIYKNAYKHYFNDRDDLTGMLNEVLQNPSEYMIKEKEL